MATYPWPQTEPFSLASMEARCVPNARISESLYTDQPTTHETPFSAWELIITIPTDYAWQRAQVEAFLTKVRGPANRVSLWHFMRPLPRGTQAANTVTAGAAAQGATSIPLNLAGTLLAGDLFGLAMTAGGVALVMATADAAAGASSTVQFGPPLRGAVSGGAVATIVRPAVPFILQEAARVGYVGNAQATPITLTFREDTNP